MSRRTKELLARREAGEEIGGNWQPMTEPIRGGDDVLVGKALKVPMSWVDRIDAIAADRGSDFSKTLRRWIEEGMARDEAAGAPDVAALARRVADEAQQLAHIYEQQQRAA